MLKHNLSEQTWTGISFQNTTLRRYFVDKNLDNKLNYEKNCFKPGLEFDKNLDCLSKFKIMSCDSLS